MNPAGFLGAVFPRMVLETRLVLFYNAPAASWKLRWSSGANPAELLDESRGFFEMNPAGFSNMVLKSAFGCVFRYFWSILGTPAEFWGESCEVLGPILQKFRVNPPRRVLEAAFCDVL